MTVGGVDSDSPFEALDDETRKLITEIVEARVKNVLDGQTKQSSSKILINQEAINYQIELIDKQQPEHGSIRAAMFDFTNHRIRAAL